MAKLNEEFGKLPEHQDPTLNVQFSYFVDTDSTGDSFDSSLSVLLDLDSTFTPNDSTFIWTMILPDTVDGPITVTVIVFERAGNSIGSYEGPEFVIDNILPDTLATGLVSGYGTPTPTPGWLNGITDSIGVWVPIPDGDPSLLKAPYGNVHIELKNVTRNPNEWVPIPRLPPMTIIADSITVPGNRAYFRTFDEIIAELDTGVSVLELAHRELIRIRAAVSDRVGNKTYYDSSSTILDYDPYKPIVSAINGGNVFNNGLPLDTLISNYNLSAEWTASSDINTLDGVEVISGSIIIITDSRTRDDLNAI
jgi:hypothetical protein